MRATLTFLAAAVVALALAASASAATALPLENFESGASGWTFSTSFWHIQNNPQTVSVLAPGINPNLVTLPDSGALPAAFSGTHNAWFGEAATGTYCGSNWDTVNAGASKNGCTSSAIESGDLISPAFDLSAAASAQLTFKAWYEIEAVDADAFDRMTVQYSVDGVNWNDLGRLNPISNPAGGHDTSYSNNGLEQAPGWKDYIVDLAPAVGSQSVQIRLDFNSGDQLFQGFRGLGVDDITVTTPFTAAAPHIASIAPSCVTGDVPEPAVLQGSGFVTGSEVLVDGIDAFGGVLSSDRIEFNAFPGQHTVQVRTPNGALSNEVTLCAPQQVTPPPIQVLPVQQVLGNQQLAPPILGETANAVPEKGKVFVQLPPGFVARHRWAHGAANKFIPLSQARTIPMGSVLDTKRGQVKLTLAGALAGSTQDGHFSQGLFNVKQSKTNPMTTLSMMGGSLGKCGTKVPKGGAAKVVASRKRRSRSLFSSVKGRFRTRGRNSSATVRGTSWVEKDTCSGTRTTVKTGTVVVQDFAKNRKVTLKPGKSYLARPPGKLRR